MHLELLRDKARTFPAIENPSEYASAKIWHCSYRTLEPLRSFRELRELTIASYPDATLEILGGLIRLESLEILHLPKVTTLSPLSGLTRLRKLSLQTLPSWDASGRKTIVESLAPIAHLPCLEELELLGVVPESRAVDELLHCRGTVLNRVRVSQYAAAEMERVRERFPA
jgi:hypothetical protein